MDFGKTLRLKRHSCFLNQAELAELAGIPRSNISQYERGRKKPSMDSLIALADALECSVDELCGRTTKGGEKA
ncbi:MAG: helix-turn-helix transcriptional regulator [Ruminococcus sp.]|nr:helix-turn-helix transcriptional regulator [Ruminococcus sp.]